MYSGSTQVLIIFNQVEFSMYSATSMQSTPVLIILSQVKYSLYPAR